MHLLDGFSEDIAKIDDLEKIQKMRGLEEEIQKFTLKVKELVEAMQKKIKEENEKKLQKIKVFVEVNLGIRAETFGKREISREKVIRGDSRIRIREEKLL